MLELTDQFFRVEPLLAATQLILSMIGMGATLALTDFSRIFRRPVAIILVLVLQFVAMPLVVAGIAATGTVPHEIVMGLYLLAVLPSGAQSNVFTYLGRGDVPLSIAATCASTVVCLLFTPLLLRLLWSIALPGDFVMPVGSILACLVFQMILPLALGMLLGKWQHARRMQIARWFVKASLVVLGLLIVGAFATGQLAIGRYGWWVPTLVVSLVIFTSVSTKLLTRALGFNSRQRFTIAVEVTLRNGPLGIALCGPLFSGAGKDHALYDAALYVCLLAGGAMLVTATVAVMRRVRGGDLLAEPPVRQTTTSG
jgi:bile acid:Na+ symporter, BASS family